MRSLPEGTGMERAAIDANSPTTTVPAACFHVLAPVEAHAPATVFVPLVLALAIASTVAPTAASSAQEHQVLAMVTARVVLPVSVPATPIVPKGSGIPRRGATPASQPTAEVSARSPVLPQVALSVVTTESVSTVRVSVTLVTAVRHVRRLALHATTAPLQVCTDRLVRTPVLEVPRNLAADMASVVLAKMATVVASVTSDSHSPTAAPHVQEDPSFLATDTELAPAPLVPVPAISSTALLRVGANARVRPTTHALHTERVTTGTLDLASAFVTLATPVPTAPKFALAD